MNQKHVNVNLKKKNVIQIKTLASIIGDSVITCSKIIDAETKTAPTNFNKKMRHVKQTNSTFYLSFY